jgi:hypothetical protein
MGDPPGLAEELRGALARLSSTPEQPRPGLSKRAKHLADQVRARVVNGNLTPVEAAALLAETIWAVLLTKPSPSFEG